MKLADTAPKTVIRADTSQIFSGLARDPVAKDMNNRQLHALALICEAPKDEPLTPGTLAEGLGISRNLTGRVLTALTIAKLVRRRHAADQEDLRVIALEPTAAGRDLHQRIARLFLSSSMHDSRAA